MPANNDACVITDCDRAVCSRGLCRKCFNSARYHIGAGHTTWEELEELGLCKPSKYTRRFAKQLTEALAGKAEGTP